MQVTQMSASCSWDPAVAGIELRARANSVNSMALCAVAKEDHADVCTLFLSDAVCVLRRLVFSLLKRKYRCMCPIIPDVAEIFDYCAHCFLGDCFDLVFETEYKCFLR